MPVFYSTLHTKAGQAAAWLDSSTTYKNINKTYSSFCRKKKHFDILLSLKIENEPFFVENCPERVPVAEWKQLTLIS